MAENPMGTDADPELEGLTEEEAAVVLRRRAEARAVDDGAGAHGGGMGASGSAVDFGQPENYTLRN